MKKFIFSFLFFSLISTISFSQIWFEDFDGSNSTNPVTLDLECFQAGAGSSNTNHGHWAEVCVLGVGCPNELLAFTSGYTGTVGEFLGALNTDLEIICDPNGQQETAEWTGIDITSCSAAETLYLCFDIAEDDNANGEGWDGPSNVKFSVAFDGGSYLGLGIFESEGSNSQASLDQDCSNVGDGIFILTDVMTNYCWELPAIAANTTMDILINIDGLNQPGEDVAIDHIGVYCESNSANLPGTLLPITCGPCGSDYDCDGVFVTQECDDMDPTTQVSSLDDQDCDGILTADDCDDTDPNNNAIITASGIMNIICDDGGTPRNPTDDFFRFTLNPTGLNLSSGYTVTGTGITTTGASYGSSMPFSTQPGTAGGGVDIVITIEDDAGSTCTLSETITDTGSCSFACEITGSGLSNVACNDAGTPSNPGDDLISFELDPFGNNLGLTYTITGAGLNPTGASYGSSTPFITTTNLAGQGNLSIIITDAADPLCSFSETVIDPGTCSNLCELTSSGLTSIMCNNAGTPSDPNDDVITFQLNPDGLNLGSSYSVTGVGLTPSSGNYNNLTTFTTTGALAGSGNFTITITDSNSPACTLTETIIDPGTCSGVCEITSSGLTGIVCDDNGTPSNPNDDLISFVLNPQGGNIGSTYTVSGVGLNPSNSGSYGGQMTFTTSTALAGSGDLNITIRDDATPSCGFNEMVADPGTCSNDCELTVSGLGGIVCDNNGTPSDPSDDLISFDLDPDGFNLGSSYTVTGVGLNPSGGNYGVSTTFTTISPAAGSGNLTITITDDASSTCTLVEIVTDPGDCSGACEITSSGLNFITCDNNGTPTDPTDDLISFELEPSGVNLGSSYTINGVSVNPPGANYNTITVFTTTAPLAGTGNLTITITDDLTSTCTFVEIVNDPGTCSNDCDLTDSGLDNIICDNNGTFSNPNDDLISFDLDPEGFNLGSTYTVSGVGLNPSSGSYGSSTTFTTTAAAAGSGNLTITITDDASSTCTLVEIVTDPGTCSNDCELTDSGLSGILCDNNGTPSNPTDDLITFELDPNGVNIGSSYTVTGAILIPNNANYGSSTIFTTAPPLAGQGDLNITINDDAASSCFINEIVADPGTCSNDCELINSGLNFIQCDDNGTPSNAADDLITFVLNPDGFNLGSTYTVTGAGLNPSAGSYGGPTSFTTTGPAAGLGNLTITITDDATSTCSLIEIVNDPGACSNAICEITNSGISNERCDNNGTPADPSDDLIIFELNPTGNTLGSTYTVTGVGLNPSGGTYGSATTFTTTAAAAGLGNLNITIEDDLTSGCTLAEVVFDPGTCSNDCELTNSGLTNIFCNDNGTPTDPSDDLITFELDPTGANLGSTYTVTGAGLSPSGGTYGSLTTFTTTLPSAGLGNLNITITDDASSTCTLAEVVTDPGTCSNVCELTTSGLNTITCDDNGTPADPSDDLITFQLNPTGSNLGSIYTVTGVGLNPSTGSYGTSTTFTTTAAAAGLGNLNITITDDASATCSLTEVVTDPGTCSANCELTASGVTNVTCNDNGTPADATDDFITFDLNPTGNNLGTNYTITGAVVTPSGGAYGTVMSYTTPPGAAGMGDLNITITDDTGANCSIQETIIDPGTCSGSCNISGSGISNIVCNDNGTPTDPSDDFITFDLNPTGGNLGTTYSIMGGTITPSVANYGTTTNFSTPAGTAGAGDLNLTIVDDATAGCTFGFTVTDPGTCSNTCNLIATGLSNVTCDDNGTPADASDDLITFQLNPTGSNLGTSYTISGAAFSPSSGNYGSALNFTAPAGMGDLNITITDDADANCSISETIIDPGTCSGSCIISGSGISNIVCDDGGTPSDPSDDFIMFDLDPMGSNLGATYSIVGVTVTPTGGSYGGVTTFSTAAGTAGDGDLNLTIIDALDSNCSIMETVSDPGTCSADCEIISIGLTNITCNDNGTPANTADDFITFDLNPMGNNLGTGYTVTGTTLTANTGSYGGVTNFSTMPGTAGSGDLNITVTDDSNSGCSTQEVVVDPGTCSGTCNLTASGLTNVQCNDGGTPTDPSDDFITFDLNPTGGNLGTNYTLTGAAVSPAGGDYGMVTSYSTMPGMAGAGDLNLTIIDGLTANCTFGVTVNDPGSCSADCELTASGLTNIQCNNNGTPSDDTDDFFTFELNPTGSNLGNSYQITGGTINPSIGNYGDATTFSTQPGSAGMGNLNITITDDTDANCSITEMVIDPGTCSSSCNLAASGLLNIQCNDGGSPTDPSDDFITFDLNPTGAGIGNTYTVSGAVLIPSVGTFGDVTSFSTAPGTAGMGDLNLIIADDDATNCSIMETVVDPGTCSDECSLIAAGITNLTCNDNGTPSNDTDDFITFDLNPTGSNLGTGYTVTGTALISNTGSYGGATNFSTMPGTAGGGDLNITITDDADANCSISELILNPGSCSGTCNLTSAGLDNIQCINNGTPSDPSDDFFTFELNPTGFILGTGYSITGANVSPANATYGMATTFMTDPGTAGGNDLNITITDDASPSCSISELITNPGSCSMACDLTDSGLTNVRCDNNGTLGDTSDDFITFDLNPTGTGLGTTYTLSGNTTTTPIVGTYGVTTSFSTPSGTAGGGNLDLIIADDAATNCSLNLTILDTGNCDNCPTIQANITPVVGVCEGESIDLEFVFSGGRAPYTVRFSDGQGINEVTTGGGSISTFEVMPTTTTTYTITEAFDADNCPAPPGSSVTVEVFTGGLNTFSDSFCEGSAYQLPDGRMVDTEGTFDAILPGQSINGCDSTIRITLTENESFDFGETIVVCDSDFFIWNGQTITTDGMFSETFQSANGCDSVRMLNVTFDGFAIHGAADAGANVEECIPEAELFGLDVAGTTGRWTSPTGATITPTNQGAAIVTDLQAGDNVFIWSLSTQNCPDFSSDTAVINVLSNDALALQPDLGVFRNSEQIQLSVLRNDDLGGLDQFTLNCINLPSNIASCIFDESTQMLNVAIENNTVGTLQFDYVICPEACPTLCDTTTVTLDITNDQDQTDYIITPAKADGLNDVLVFDNLDQFPENELVVYNRWGSVVFRAQPYQNDWGGLYNGNLLPEADYYYVIRKELPQNIEFGIVTIKY